MSLLLDGNQTIEKVRKLDFNKTMNLHPSISNHQSIQPPLPSSKINQPYSFSELGNQKLKTNRLSRAPSSRASLTLKTQDFSENIPILSAKRSNSFTFIQPSPFIQNRLAANARTSIIKLIYGRNVPQRVRAAFRYAANIWQTLISSRVPIKIQVNWQKGDESILSFGGPTQFWRNFSSTVPFENTWYPVALANKLAGRDLSPELPDGVISLNSRQPWYLGTNGKVPRGKFDLVTVAMHETYHAISFSGLMNYNPQTNKGSWGFGTGFPGLYDRFTMNGSKQRLLNPRLFPNPSQTLGRQLTGNNLFFGSSRFASPSHRTFPKLFAPGSWILGSSYVHLDERTYGIGNPNSLITPFFNLSEAVHDPGSIAVGILKDMGWIPESLNPGRGRLINRSLDWREIERDRTNRFAAIDFRTI